MFSKVAITTLSLAAVAFAAATGPQGGQCNTGPVQCCNQVQDARHAESVDRINVIKGIQKYSAFFGNLVGADLSDLLKLKTGDITGQVGLECSPVSVIGIAGNSCSAQPVCCSGNNFNGLVVVGCTPINVNL
ncbi:hypothetical protein HGRIS_003184 [Hohenbuehelia grisea]|uniref:Hydrophobin n=1 Tax=Hohenbuehelia grisea TaxID=104357 RepID=A0ABR3JMQ3_9AGAR